MMTNYERLLQQNMNDPQFMQCYYDTRLERLFDEMLNTLKEKIDRDEPKEHVLKEIDSIQQQLHLTVERISRTQSMPQKHIEKATSAPFTGRQGCRRSNLQEKITHEKHTSQKYATFQKNMAAFLSDFL